MQRRLRTSVFRCIVGVCLASAASCGGDDPTSPSARTATQLKLIVAPPSAVQSGAELSTPPVIQLADAQGNAVGTAGIAITAGIDAGTIGGTSTVSTAADGRATFSGLRLDAPIGTRKLTFGAAQLSAVGYDVTVLPGRPAQLVATTATTQTAGTGRPVPIVPAVRITDGAGNPVAGLAVTFTITAGGGSMPSGAAVSGVDGTATISAWILGNAAGENSMRVAAAGLAQDVIFTAFGTVVTPALVIAFRGDDGSAQRLTAVTVPPAVRVTDAAGAGVAGVAVTFEVIEGGGTITGAGQMTGVDGVAAVGSWTLGSVIGLNRLAATAAGVPGTPVIFSAQGLGIGTISAFAGASQTAPPGAAVPVAPVARIVDRSGQGVPGVPVTFAIASGGGSITGAQQVTDATGRATVGSWSLGPQVGVNTLHASAVGVDMSPAVFTATAFAVVPARLAVHAGQGQSARINTAVPIAPAVIVTNAAGTPAPGQLVTFVAEGGTIADASVVTGADGVASPGAWTLGSTAGSHDLVATAAGLQGSPLRFQAMATPGPPARLVPQVDPGNSVVGMAVSDPPGVYVQDAGENNLSGVQVTFAVTSGSVTGAVKLTDESGHAAPDGWVLGTTAGVQNLTATVAGLPPLTLPIEAVADELASIELAGGNGQTAGVRRMLPLDLVVKYEDRYGNPVRAQDVVLEVPDGGQITDVRASGADGLTRFRWRLGSSVGIQTVTATKPEIPGQSVVFTAVATAVNSQFAIDLRYLGSIAPPHQAAFEAAVARWRDIILDDVPQWELSLPADFCFDGQPLVDESVDDLVIFVQVQPFDGVGGVLGAAGACVLRSGSHLPVMGVMIFDSADLDDIASHGELPDVVLHEMGHVLGFGTTWQDHGLVFGVNTFNPIFTGTFARAEYESLGGSGAVPVENTGGVGTAYVHWRESVFANELMTGFIGGAPNPLSRLTIGSMRDLGYGVDYGTADGFGGTALRRERGVRLRQLREKPLERPIVVTQPDGSISGQRPR